MDVGHEQPIDGTSVVANNEADDFHFFITSINEEGSSSESDEIVTPPLKCAHTRGAATVVGRACTRGGATVGRARAHGGATVGRVRARGAVGQNRGCVRRNGRGGRIGNHFFAMGKD